MEYFHLGHESTFLRSSSLIGCVTIFPRLHGVNELFGAFLDIKVLLHIWSTWIEQYTWAMNHILFNDMKKLRVLFTIRKFYTYDLVNTVKPEGSSSHKICVHMAIPFSASLQNKGSSMKTQKVSVFKSNMSFSNFQWKFWQELLLQSWDCNPRYTWSFISSHWVCGNYNKKIRYP